MNNYITRLATSSTFQVFLAVFLSACFFLWENKITGDNWWMAVSTAAWWYTQKEVKRKELEKSDDKTT